jgi:hypothetical protein
LGKYVKYKVFFSVLICENKPVNTSYMHICIQHVCSLYGSEYVKENSTKFAKDCLIKIMVLS